MRRLTLALLLLCGLAGGCSDSNTLTMPGALDVLTLSSITPAAGTKLAPGSTVTFTATLFFMVNSAGSAEVSMVVEDQANHVLNAGNQPTSVLPNGQGTVNLPGQFTIPASGVSELQVVYMLTPNLSVPRVTSASATYPVGP